MPKLGNCPKCGRLYLRIRDICEHCIEKQEDDFRKVADYLRQYPGCSIQELSDATDVSTNQIRQFIVSGRIVAGNFPNLTYPCENCGEPTTSGKLCSKCLKSVQELKTKVENSAESNANQPHKTNGYISKYL